MNATSGDGHSSRTFAFNLTCLVFSLFSYALSMLSLLYLMGFLSRTLVPKHIDSGEQGSWLAAAIIDLGLISLFALQHSLMARPTFKQRTQIPPQIERAAYVLCSSLALILLMAMWQPIAQPLWSIESPLARAVLAILYWLGWVIVLLATFLLSHFELFGIKQAIAGFSPLPHGTPVFSTPFFYKVVRHPLYLGFLIAFWSTPDMTAGHLLFAVACSIYIVIGTRLEERELRSLFGATYERYQQTVSMLIPLPGKQRKQR
ncbi:methanethiol S-methyltransferase [Pseudomonas soli]|uniref:methanethiol S-methyltransferase n=1 Tax=Pseudomonas soli TaxID=1306993 RepID=UPI0037FDDC26